MNHSFNIDVATKYGVNCAIILENIYFWVEHNKANNTNFHDGRYWTYNSAKAFTELFPYLTKRQIELALKKLRDDGLIVTANYNQSAYDRTLWYSITDKGISMLHSCDMEVTNNVNGNDDDVTPIPDSKHSCKTVGKQYKKETDEIITYLNEKAKKSFKLDTPKTLGYIKARLRQGFTVEDFKTVIDNKCRSWLGNEYEKYLRPETLFGNKFEGYLNEKGRKDTSLDDIF